MWSLILLPVAAFFIGVISAMLGIGGGVFIVPMLILAPCYSLSPAVASGTSLAAIVFTSASSTLRYMRQRRIDHLLGLFLALTTVPGAFLGSYSKRIIDNRLLGVIFAVFLIFIAARMFTERKGVRNWIRRENVKAIHRKIIDSYGETFIYSVDPRLTPILGLAAGFFSGLLGIGGGSILVPAMNLIIGVPMHLSIATSMFIMVFTSVSGTLTNLWLGHVRLDYAILLAAGVIFGAQIGAHIAARVSARNLRRIFGVILILTSIRMLLKFTGIMP
ncbi:sulfite exporter TauE/SafE family protein [Candidatus Bathyarchaeota archaeon]|nr:sulfite exporter TauE/SafE family protein [Candidatus Bathyarchaeota archaeon]